MPEQLLVSKPTLALPLPGTMGTTLPSAPSLPKKTRERTVAQPRTVAQTSAAVQAREDRITHFFFLAYMTLTILGIGAVGFALMTM